MNKALQQTYYFQDGYLHAPSDGFPVKISERQYKEAVRALKEDGCYIPTDDNPSGEDVFKEREFLMENCDVKLNASSQLHNGKNTKVIRTFAKENDRYSLERLAENLNLPLPQWGLRND